MNVDHRLNHGVVHLVEGLVAQDACVVDQHVNPAERIDRGLHDILASFGGSHAVVVGHRDPAGGGDLVDDPVCGGQRGTAAIECPTQVVDQDLRSPSSEFERVTAPEPPTGTSDDGYASVKA